jgi:predicted PurR-regulated permease PerM
MSASDIREAPGEELPAEKEASWRSNVPSAGIGTLTVIATAAALYFASEVFVPLAIAGLLAFVLAPPMLWLRHHGLGRALSAIAVVTLAFIAMLGFGAVVIGEVASLTQQLPSYQPNIESKLQSLRQEVPVDRLIQQGTQLLQDLRAELTPPQATLAPAPNPKGNQTPVPVEIQQQTGFLQILNNYIGPVLKPIALAGLVLVFVIFFLLNRENLRDRFIRLAGAHDLHRTTQMLNDAVERLSRYLWTELVVNAIYGALMSVGTFLIGVPNAALWGVMFLVLRFVPYIGTWVTALFPLALSLAIAPGWSAFFETFGLFIAVELITSQAIEPWLFGASAGLSPVAVLVAATFWTWLWGPVGLVLSTPLTVCLVVIGRYVPALRYFAVLLGDEAPLAVEESFYQRLLAGDDAEVTEQAETFLKSGSLAEFCDQIAIPALTMAQEDSERGVLTRNSRAEINETLHEVVENIGEEAAEPSERTVEEQPVVECLGARNELDDAAALLLARLLNEQGIAARAVPARHWMTEPRFARPPAAQAGGPKIICLSHLGTASPPRLRLLARRLRRHAPPDAGILLGLWSAMPHYVDGRPQTPETIDDVATSVGEALDYIVARVAPDKAPAGRANPHETAKTARAS